MFLGIKAHKLGKDDKKITQCWLQTLTLPYESDKL